MPHVVFTAKQSLTGKIRFELILFPQWITESLFLNQLRTLTLTFPIINSSPKRGQPSQELALHYSNHYLAPTTILFAIGTTAADTLQNKTGRYLCTSVLFSWSNIMWSLKISKNLDTIKYTNCRYRNYSYHPAIDLALYNSISILCANTTEYYDWV